MYIEAVPNRNSPPAVLLRESYRVGGKIKKRTLLNLSDWSPPLVEGLRALLNGGTVLPPGQEAITIKRSLPHGHVAAVLGTLRRIATTSERRNPISLSFSPRRFSSCYVQRYAGFGKP